MGLANQAVTVRPAIENSGEKLANSAAEKRGDKEKEESVDGEGAIPPVEHRTRRDDGRERRERERAQR